MSNLFRLFLLPLLVAAFLLGAHWQHRAGELKLLKQLRAHDADLQAAEETIKTILKTMDKTLNSNARLAAELSAEQARKNKIITNQVIKYVQSPNAGNCAMPVEWVRIHDNAATGEGNQPTNTPSGVDDSTRAITDADAIAVIANNYELCRDTRTRLINLQQWARTVSGG